MTPAEIAAENMKALTALSKTVFALDQATRRSIAQCDATRPVVNWKTFKRQLQAAWKIIEAAEAGKG